MKVFFFSSRRRHTRYWRDWSSDVCSSDLYLREAEELARTLDDPRRLGWVSAYMSGHHLHTGGHATEVRTLAQRVDAIAERLGDVPLQIAAQYYLAAGSRLSGDYRWTEHLCRKLMQSLPDQRTRERFGLVVFPAVM